MKEIQKRLARLQGRLLPELGPDHDEDIREANTPRADGARNTGKVSL